MEEAKRYAFLDMIRGFTVISMIFYHGVWDLVYIFGFDWPWYRSAEGVFWQQSICWTFIFLSGFCQPLGSSGFRRGWKVFLAGALVSVSTLLIMPENRVIFGVLTLIGSCMLLVRVFERFMGKMDPNLGFVLSMAIFLFLRDVSLGYLGFFGRSLLALPQQWYQNLFTAYLGFPTETFYSADYFPLLPWFFLFTAGYFFFRMMERREILPDFQGVRLPCVEWTGRNSLPIYLIHQPALYGIFWLWFSLGGR